jgi:hypothetical protein
MATMMNFKKILFKKRAVELRAVKTTAKTGSKNNPVRIQP